MKKSCLKFIFIMVLLQAVVAQVLFAKEIRTLSENESLDRYYQSLYIGEKRTSNYYGQLDSRSFFNPQNGELTFLDDQFANRYLDDQIQAEAFDLHQLWFKKIVDKSSCPDMTLGQNIDYIRYLYRLLTISYLFESLKINYKISRQLGTNDKRCDLSYDEIFRKCKPHSDDMKKFQERVYGKFVNEISKLSTVNFTKAQSDDWLNSFKRSTSLTLDPVVSQLHDWCSIEKKNCRDLSFSEIKNAIGETCTNDKDLMREICNEQDNLFGVSYSEKATELIETSNAFNLINATGTGGECLRRYVKIFAPKEVYYNLLNHQFPLIYSQLVRENSRYPQGELFLPGALKEFDVKGLSDFLVALKPPPVETVKVIKAKPKPKPTPKPVVVVVKKPEVLKPEPVAMVIEEPKPVIKVSEFERALEELETKKLETLSINMDIFRDDFEFTQQMIADLATPIKKFQTRAALTDMKSYDSLGSKEAPVGLIFLKYLIDTENHQGLYNMVTVLGERFYVNNDIEKKNYSVLIELRNDATTKNRWQIILVQPPKYTPKK